MSTLYDIRLRIAYSYHAPALTSRNILRIVPRVFAGQDVVRSAVTCTPSPSRRYESVDFFGNPMTEIAFDHPITRVEFVYEGRLRRHSVAAPVGEGTQVLDLPSDLAALTELGPMAPHHFLGGSDRVRPEAEITEFAHTLVAADMPALKVVRAISSGLNRAMTFDSGATDAATPPLEAFRNRRGVCQDISHIMIAALRGLGIPAGYVSGFLRTEPPAGQARLAGADAMHAWVQAWCGRSLGWVQIDPTNDLMVGEGHVVVGIGRDYADVAPVRGAIRAAGGHGTLHQVDVVPVSEAR